MFFLILATELNLTLCGDECDMPLSSTFLTLFYAVIAGICFMIVIDFCIRNFYALCMESEVTDAEINMEVMTSPRLNNSTQTSQV